MADNHRVSVVLCTFNGQAFLNEQLDSLLTQSRLPDEVIVGDDASTDGTWRIVEAFVARAAARGMAVHTVRRPERLGYIANFSASLALASGDIVFLCDQDDAWHPDKVAAMLARFADPGLTLVHSDARLVDREGRYLDHGLFDALELTARERERVRAGAAFGVYLRRNIATGAATAFRRVLLEKALPVPSNWVHDAWLAVVAAAIGGVGIVDDTLIDYRQHGANQIGMRRRTLAMRINEFRLPRGDELRVDVARLDALAERLQGEGAGNALLDEIAAMRSHLVRRLRIGEACMVCRILPVAREWASGGYTHFATGARTALRDLLRKG